MPEISSKRLRSLQSGKSSLRVTRRLTQGNPSLEMSQPRSHSLSKLSITSSTSSVKSPGTISKTASSKPIRTSYKLLLRSHLQRLAVVSSASNKVLEYLRLEAQAISKASTPAPSTSSSNLAIAIENHFQVAQSRLVPHACPLRDIICTAVRNRSLQTRPRTRAHWSISGLLLMRRGLRCHL